MFSYISPNVAFLKSGYGIIGMKEPLSSVDSPKCDNVVATLTLANIAPTKPSFVDKFQLLISTSPNWDSSSIIEVGDPFPYYDSTQGVWGEHKIVTVIPNISEFNEVYLGIKVIAAGYSYNEILCVKSLSVDFLASATPDSISIVNSIDDREIERWLPCMTNAQIKVGLNTQPDIVDVKEVWATVVIGES